MHEVELALAALTGLGTPSVADQFKQTGLIDDLGLPISDPYSYSTGKSPYYMTTPDAAPKTSTKTGASKTGRAIKEGLGTALTFADDLVTPAAKQAQLALLNASGGVGAGGKAGLLGHVGRFAASPKALMLAKVGTGIGALGGVIGAADVLVGNDSLANKAMDTTAMAIGGTLGAVGGPVGIAAGAGLGKAASDVTQFLLGGGKSAEERKLEEAIIALRGGNI